MKKLLLVLITLMVIVSSGCFGGFSLAENDEFPDYAFMVTTLNYDTYDRVEGALVKIEGKDDFWQDYTNKDGKVVIHTPYDKFDKAMVTVKKDGCNTLSREYSLESEKMIAIVSFFSVYV